MENVARGGQRYLRAEDIVFLTPGSRIPEPPAWRRGRPRSEDTPAWVSDPHFALWTVTWQPTPSPAAGGGHRRRAKRARVDAAAAAALQEVTGRSRSGEECAICLKDFGADETLRAMPCSRAHAFHRDCIDEWLRRSDACPLCRHRLPAAPAPEEEEEEDEDEPHDGRGDGEEDDEEGWEWEDGAIG